MRLKKLLVLTAILLAAAHSTLFAQDAPREAVFTAPEAPEVHLPSIGGGTGMLWGRGGQALREDEKNISLFYEFMNYNTIPILRTRLATDPTIEDPRGDEHWVSLSFNIGITNWLEAGIRVPFVFGDDTGRKYTYTDITGEVFESGPGNIRGSSLGRTALDARFRILHHDRFGLGMVFGAFVEAPGGEDATSKDVNFRGELGLTLEGRSFEDYVGPLWFDKYILEPLDFHGAVSWGQADYLRFNKFPSAPEWKRSTFYREQGPVNVNRNWADPEIISTEIMHLNFGFTYEPYEHFTIGAELLMDQFPDQANDNNLVLAVPEFRYNWRNIWSFHTGFAFTGVRRDIDDQPDWMASAGVTYHFWWPETAKSVQERLEPTPIDLMEFMMPSRKPIPIEEPIEVAPEGEMDIGPE